MQESLEQQLSKEKQKNMLCAGLSREIYQALSAIRSSSGLLEQEVQLAVPSVYQKLGWMFENINQSTLRLSRVAENLQDMIEAERGVLRFNSEPLDLVWQYTQMLNMLACGAVPFEVQIAWKCELKENEIYVWGNSDWADKILLNLVSNAMLCSQAGQRVTVSLEKAGQELCLKVIDQGPGLPAWVCEHMFEAFVNCYETDGTAKGAGLGLYLANTYCKVMGWNLVINSDAKGTVATVHIPLNIPNMVNDSEEYSVLKSTAAALETNLQKQRVMAELSVLRTQKEQIE